MQVDSVAPLEPQVKQQHPTTEIIFPHLGKMSQKELEADKNLDIIWPSKFRYLNI